MAGGRYQFLLPVQVDERLEDLRRRAVAQGNRASRSDIVAAVIWATTVDGDELGVMIRQCRRETLSVAVTPSAVRRPGPQAQGAELRFTG